MSPLCGGRAAPARRQGSAWAAPLEAAWRAAIAACDAGEAVRRWAGRQGAVRLASGRPVWLFALGKAADGMALGAREALTVEVTRALVVGPRGAGPPSLPDGWARVGGEHPLPGAGSFEAGEAALAFARAARRAGASVLALVSGGGSALMEAPAPGETVAGVRAVHEGAWRSDAPIAAMNAKRTAVSAVKGGLLGRAFGEALVGTVVVSDVVTGGASVVSSGPTIPMSGRAGGAPHWVVASPHHAAAAAWRALHAAGARGVTLGPATDGVPWAGWGHRVREHLESGAPRVWIGVGEPEVAVADSADGAWGGRLQHLAGGLLAQPPEARGPWAVLCGATDGCDGVGAAGAWATGEAVTRASALGLAPRDAVRAFDTGPLHAALGTALPVAPATTNVTDLVLAATPAAFAPC